MPLYHRKNDRHNLTKKSNFFHFDFEKSILSYFLLLYQLYVNLYANLRIKASIQNTKINKIPCIF